jgi:hypothetical protein
MPATSSPEKDDGNGLLAATRFNAELIMIGNMKLFSIFLLRLNQAYVTSSPLGYCALAAFMAAR